jgi:hypothetical protein
MVVGMLLLFVITIGALGAHGCRSELQRAREVCGHVRPGIPLLDAEHDLDGLGASYLGGRLIRPGGPNTSYQYGRRGSVVSWECELEIDTTDHVTGTSFTAWLVMDFHGTWDDRASLWIERHWL